MTAGQKKTLSVNAVNGKGDTITFTSNKKGVVKVNKASAKANAKKVASTTVTAVAEGTAKITAKSKYTGKSKTFTIKVVAATPAPTQAPSVATTPAITTPSATPGVATTPAVKVTATPGTDASATPGTDATATPGADATQNPDATPGADATTTPGTDATKNPDATQTPDVPVAEKGNVAVTTNVSGASIKVLSGTSVVAEKTLEGEDFSATLTDIANGTYTVQVSKAGYGTFTEVVTIAGNTVNVKADIEVVALKNVKVTSETRLQLNFNGEVDVETVKVENFKVSGVTVTDAKLTEDKKSVILETTTMTKDEKYTVSTANLTSNGIAIANAEQEFIGKEIHYELKLSFAGDKTTLVSNGKDAILVTATLYDEDGEQVKDLDKVEIKFTTTAGNFAENRVTVQNGVATNMLTSEISTTDINALVTATVVSASNKNLLNVTTSRTIVMTPKVDAGEDQTIGATLTDIAVETCDRVVLYFNKDVDVTDYTKQDTTKKEVYTYDDQKLEVLVQDKASNEQTEVGTTNRRKVKALAPVEGNSKALYAILDVSIPGKQLTDNSKVIVKVTDKTKKVDAVATKSTLVSDIRVPSILAVENDGLTTLKITFSEPVQTTAGAGGQNTYVADDATHWIIDGTPLNNTKYGAGTPNDGNKGVTVKVGDFNEETGVDSRNIVTIKLGKTAAGKQIYFTSGSHSIQGNNIGDWANLTDTQNNIINTQTLDFAIDPDNTIPTAEVKVESPEQYTVTFNKAVSVDEVKANLELQVYNTTSAKWVENEDTGIVITPVNKTEDETAKEFVVEVDTDWTKQLKTATTHVNYYNNSYRLSIAANTITNLSNGVKNAEINMALNDEIMTSPDTTSPTIKEVKQVGTTNKVTITMSEPVQIPGLTGETITSSQIQDPSNAGNKVGVPNVTVTFISEDNKTTIPATIDKMVDEHDTSFVVIPDGTLTEGKWKVVVASISDDVGNTSSTQTYNDVEIKEVTETVDTSFKVQWIVAVPADQADPISGGTNTTEDLVYVKFNKNFKTYGSSANAVSTTNYTINGYAVPTTSKIASSVDGYNDKANTKNNYTDLAAIHLKANTLTSSANTINISSTIEAYAGGTLSNAGMKTLDKVGDIFTYNYKTLSANTPDGGSNANTPNMTDTLAELKAALANSAYVNVVADALVNDANVYADATAFQKAIKETELKISSVGTYDLSHSLDNAGAAYFKKLTIDTKETGTIRITGGNYGEIVVNAPNAEVYIENGQITKSSSAPTSTGSLVVEDVLEGTLKLTNTVIQGDLEIKDSNNGGAVVIDANTSVAGDVIVNTADEVALSIKRSDVKVVIKKAAIVDFSDSVKIAKLTLDSNGVKLLSDLTTTPSDLVTGGQITKTENVTEDVKITASETQAYGAALKGLATTETSKGKIDKNDGATIDLTKLAGYDKVKVTIKDDGTLTTGYSLDENNVISIAKDVSGTPSETFVVTVETESDKLYYDLTIAVETEPTSGTTDGVYTVVVAPSLTTYDVDAEAIVDAYIADPTNSDKREAADKAVEVYARVYSGTASTGISNYATYAATPGDITKVAAAKTTVSGYSASKKLSVSSAVNSSNIQSKLSGDLSDVTVTVVDGSNSDYVITIKGATNTNVVAEVTLSADCFEVGA